MRREAKIAITMLVFVVAFAVAAVAMVLFVAKGLRPVTEQPLHSVVMSPEDSVARLQVSTNAAGLSPNTARIPQ